MNLLRVYERLLKPYAVWGPDYNLLHRRDDGRTHGVARLGFHASWAVYGAVLTMGLALVRPSFAIAHPLVPAIGAVVTLFLFKIMHVLNGTYRADPLDWCCDVGAWGSAGALLTAQLVLHAHVSLWVWPALLVLYLLAYPWATP